MLWTIVQPEEGQARIKYKYKYDDPDRGQILGDHDPPPFNLTIYKGAKSWRLPRRFVHFLLNHPVAQTFLGKVKNQSVLGVHVQVQISP